MNSVSEWLGLIDYLLINKKKTKEYREALLHFCDWLEDQGHPVMTGMRRIAGDRRIRWPFRSSWYMGHYAWSMDNDNYQVDWYVNSREYLVLVKKGHLNGMIYFPSLESALFALAELYND